MASWQPTTEDLLRVVDEQNPWHADGSVPAALAPPTERALVQPLFQRVLTDEPRRFQVILGHRRVGKTTVMYHLVQRLLAHGWPPHRLRWHRLDHPLLMQIPLDQLVRSTIAAAGASREEPAVVLLDEVVYARDWDLWLKTFYDEHWPIRILATSSATATLRERRTESGVGRWEELRLTPYLLGDYLDLRGQSVEVPVQDCLADSLAATAREPAPDLRQVEDRRRELMLAGGFPELLTHIEEEVEERSLALLSQRVLRDDAVERAVYKDIPQSFGIESPLDLERVLYVLAGQTAGVLSPTNISRDLGISQPTVDRYLSYLELAFLVFVLPNFSGRETKVQRRGRKLYFVDGAVRNAALQRGTAPLADPTELGLLMENMAAAHLHALALQSQVRLFHWRAGDAEVDLVYDHPDRPVAVEVASSPRHDRFGLQALAEHHPRFRDGRYLVAPGAPAICPGDGTGGIGSLPLDLFLLVVSAQASRALEERLTGLSLG